MIDKISFVVKSESCPKMEDQRISFKGNAVGKYKNLQLVQYPNEVFCSGSIAKFYNGENITTLTRESLIKALKQLEEETGWDLHKTSIKNLEVGATINLKHHPSNYLKEWVHIPRNKKIMYWDKTLDTVIFRTGDRSFQGYNKTKESKKDIPPEYMNCNLLRLEQKYKRNIKKYIGDISLWDLTNERIYGKLVNNWKKSYLSIAKERDCTLDTTDMITPTKVKDLFSSFGILHYGYNEALSLVGSLQETGKMGDRQVTRTKQNILSLLNDNSITELTNISQELDSRVFEWANNL